MTVGLALHFIFCVFLRLFLNPLNGTLKPQSNGPYSNTLIGTMQAVGEWSVVYIWYSEEGPGRAVASPNPLFAVPPIEQPPPHNGQCTHFILFDVALQVPLFVH